jgi:4-amino-4-deoxy-L-arabinose transferase-like glycosyltransferase
MRRWWGNGWGTLLASRDTHLLVAVAAVCLIPRIVLWFAYEPIVARDTRRYFELAHMLSGWDFSDFVGGRTPGFPLLLLLGGLDHRVIWLLQSLLGVATATLLFALTLRQTRSRTAALIAGLCCGLSINLIFFEATLLTEALATFLLVLAVFLYARIVTEPDVGTLSYVALGTVVALAGLTRPLFLFAIPLYLLILLLPRRRPQRVRLALSFLFPVIILVFGWCAVVWRATGSFKPTTLLGYNLTQHSGGFFELVPDDDARLRDIYLRHRAARVAKIGSHTHTIWSARPEMLKTTGLGPGELSDELTRISIALFVAHPRLYLESVRRAWLRFWDSKLMLRDEFFHYPQSLPALLSAWRTQKTLLQNLKKMLLPGLVWYLVCAVAGRRRRAAEVPLFVLALIGSASLVQALVELGENARYAIPFQPLIIFVVVGLIWDAARTLGSVLLPAQKDQAARGHT